MLDPSRTPSMGLINENRDRKRCPVLIPLSFHRYWTADVVSIYSNIEIWGAGFPRLCLPRVRFFRPSTEWQKLYLYLRTLKFWVRGSRSKIPKYFGFVDPVRWASYYDDKTFSFISPRGGVLLGSSIRSRELLQAWIGRQGRLSTIQNKFRPRWSGGCGGCRILFPGHEEA